jgi:hypothetical protein
MQVKVGEAGDQKFPRRVYDLGVARQRSGIGMRDCLNFSIFDDDGYVGLRVGASSVNQGDVGDRERPGRIFFRAATQKQQAK